MTTTNLPDWATVGAEVVIAHGRATGSMSRTTITKITPKSIVTGRGTRFTFSVLGWTAKGDHSWEGTPKLLAVDDPRAVAYFADQARGAAAYAAEQALGKWRYDPTAVNLHALKAALDALAPHLTDTTED